MAYSTPATRATGYIVTAANWNELVNDIVETAVAKVTTAGDLTYATAANVLARLGIGTVGQLLRVNVGATAPAWGIALDPWLVYVLPVFAAKAHTNWNTITQSNLSHLGGYLSSSAAQNDQITWDIVLSPGTWTVWLHHFTNTDAGIYSIQLDSVEVGTIDGYANPAVENVLSSVTGISVATGGKIELKLRMATKHASSTAYRGVIRMIVLQRTA